MADKIIKCANYSKCKQKWNFISIKGSNNTELCSKCGSNICFICGKKWNKEENFRWEEDYDCCGNKKMVKAYYDMYNQEEKDEKHPEGNLIVYYCDEHRSEGEKSPNKWTKADQEQLEKKREQEKQAREQKINNSKGLFYCNDPYDRTFEVEGKKMEGIDYGCIYFQGQENGRNYNLLVPDTHPDLANFRYKKKSKRLNGQEVTRWTLKKQFYLIEGVENLPLEATSPNSHNSQFNVPDLFAKIVNLTDRIKITPADNQKTPEKNEPGNNQDKKNDVKNQIKQFLEKNNLKISDLPEKYQNWETDLERLDSKEKIETLLQEIKKIEKKANNSDVAPTTKPKTNYLWAWMGCGIIGGVIIILITRLLLRRKKKSGIKKN